ncbi:LPS export ABC transporter periplasmic protein LptC [Sphingomonas sp.]|uniref:LPS export ABC transporter periplasmic protein LptC n=1 Tax=Sphingomonas sp. TaxID=28214 RepID=UPI001AFDFD64|nr:LPS export ABC transporter periplasmic protein LptC [Sphingomonas sp.]MBO9714223.1 LPS export ABC transporter periplasmic protein LptC [Sphingomonas sp.]
MSEIAQRLQSQRRAWAHPGSGHDRIVRTLQWLLPMGIGVLGAFLVVSPLYTAGEVSFVLDKNKVDVASARLQAESAIYRGEDSKGRAFQLHAGSAVQKSSAEPIVQLKQLSAEIALEEGPGRIDADSGRYDLDTRKLAVDGPIRFQTADGYRLQTSDSTVDLRTRQMESSGPVNGSTPMGVFSGNKLTADLEKRIVKLDGNARLRIQPRKANRR